MDKPGPNIIVKDLDPDTNRVDIKKVDKPGIDIAVEDSDPGISKIV